MEVGVYHPVFLSMVMRIIKDEEAVEGVDPVRPRIHPP